MGGNLGRRTEENLEDLNTAPCGIWRRNGLKGFLRDWAVSSAKASASFASAFINSVLSKKMKTITKMI